MFFFFNDTATPEIYTLSLHDALPISPRLPAAARSLATNPSAVAAVRRRRRHPRQRNRVRGGALIVGMRGVRDAAGATRARAAERGAVLLRRGAEQTGVWRREAVPHGGHPGRRPQDHDDGRSPSKSGLTWEKHSCTSRRDSAEALPSRPSLCGFTSKLHALNELRGNSSVGALYGWNVGS